LPEAVFPLPEMLISVALQAIYIEAALLCPAVRSRKRGRLFMCCGKGAELTQAACCARGGRMIVRKEKIGFTENG